MVPRQNEYHGPIFPATRGTMKGGLVSPTLFSVIVKNIIRTWLAITVDDQRVAHDRMREAVGRCLGVFYADDGMVGSRDSEWLQHLMNILVGLF